MKILFDHQVFSIQKYGGISRYFCELMHQYEINSMCDFSVGAKLSNNSYLPKIKSQDFYSFFPNQKFKGQGQFMYQLNQLVTNKALKDPNASVIHPTYYDPYILSKAKKPFVLTCHDLIHERFGDKFEKLNDDARKYKKPLLEAASAIIAVSENTKKDIIEIYGIPESSIDVIHLASSISYNTEGPQHKIDLPEQYLLYVGNRNLYKNFSNYLKAIAPLLRQHNTLKLICAGGGAFTNAELKVINQLNLASSLLFYAIDDTLLATLYFNAIGLVFPSLYEGFGIPVLEAFSCNCPVLLSNNSSLPEVAGDAALYFDPTSDESMLEATKYFVENVSLRNKLIEKGKMRNQNFNWSKTANLTVNLYKKLV